MRVILTSENSSFLCFRHAVLRAINNKEDIKINVVDDNTNRFTNTGMCTDCFHENLKYCHKINNK